MSKFKVGDKARVVKNVTGISTKDEYIGKIYTLHGTQGGHPMWGTAYRIDETYIVYESELVPATTHKIVITSDGETTLARLYDGKKVIKTARAKCAPEDEFDFETGAKIAFRRLVKPAIDPVESKSKYYTGRAVCVKGGFGLTAGKTYSFKNGICTNVDYGCRMFNDPPVASVDEMNVRLPLTKLVEIEED